MAEAYTFPEINFLDTDPAVIVDALLKQMEAEVKEPLYPGDERRIFSDALAAAFVSLYFQVNDLMKQSLLRYARGNVLDAIGERLHCTRMAGDYAKVTLRFSIQNPAKNNLIIPQGTRVTADSTLYFATTEVGVIYDGLQTCEVEARAVEIGAVYNGLEAGSITTIVDQVPFIGEVVNLTETAGGDDGEPYTTAGDNRYRERIRIAPSKRSTAGSVLSYKYYAMSADARIIDARPVRPEPGVICIYPLLAGGELPDADVLQKVLEATSPTDVRPMDDRVYSKAPGVVEYDIDIVYYTTKGNEASVVAMVEESGGAIERYNEWETAAMERDINPDELRKRILAPDWEENMVGAIRLDVNAPAHTPVGETEVARFSGTLHVEHRILNIEGVG